MSNADQALAVLATFATSEKAVFNLIEGPTHEGLEGNHLYINGRIELTDEQVKLVKDLLKPTRRR